MRSGTGWMSYPPPPFGANTTKPPARSNGRANGLKFSKTLSGTGSDTGPALKSAAIVSVSFDTRRPVSTNPGGATS